MQEYQFQFPSNGKVDPNAETEAETQTTTLSFNSLQTGKWILTTVPGIPKVSFQLVSIPFKRESGS